jgi:hypothetical protein
MTATELVRGTLAFLGTYALHSTAFLGAMWALCALCQPRSLRLRERLWKLALVGGLASAALQLSLVSDPWLGSIDWRPPAGGEPTRGGGCPRPAREPARRRACVPGGGRAGRPARWAPARTGAAARASRPRSARIEPGGGGRVPAHRGGTLCHEARASGRRGRRAPAACSPGARSGGTGS